MRVVGFSDQGTNNTAIDPQVGKQLPVIFYMCFVMSTVKIDVKPAIELAKT